MNNYQNCRIHHFLITSFVLLVSGFIVNPTLHAEDYVAESDFFGESPVVLTVSRLNKPLSESPASVTVIDRQMIKDSGARDVADIFNMVPGFFVTHISYSSNTPQVVYHGLGEEFYRQLQVLIDGRSVFIPSFGGVPWSNLPLLLEDIERVEVIRGPNSATYGANAFMATINIITRHAAEDSGIYLSTLRDLNENKDDNNVYFRAGNQIGDVDWRLTAGREEDDGIVDIHDSTISEKFNFRTDIVLAHNQYLSFLTGINETKTNKGDGSVTDIFRDKESTNSYQNIQWEIIDDNTLTKINFFHTRQNVDDKFETLALNSFLGLPGPPPEITTFINFDRLSDRLDFEAFQNRKFNEHITINYGLSLRKDEVRSFFIFNNPTTHSIKTKRVFSNIEWKSSHDTIIDFGLMVEKNRYTDTETTGRFTAIQKVGNHHLRMVVSSARRNQVLWNLIGETEFVVNTPIGVTVFFPESIGNPELQPEKILSREIGVFSEFFERSLITDIRLFKYTIDDQNERGFVPITPSTDPTIVIVGTSLDIQQNTARTDVEGLEISFNHSPENKKYRLYGGFTRLLPDSSKSDYEVSFPNNILFLGGHINFFQKHQISMQTQRVGKMRMVDARGSSDAVNRLNARYQYTVNAAKGTTLEIIGHNLHEDYDDFGNNQLQEKSYYLRFSTRF